MIFWIPALLIVVLAAASLTLAMLRGRARFLPSADYDVQIYRDQLQEVERDLARGVVTPQEAERIRLEVSRRLLEADRAAQAHANEYTKSQNTFAPYVVGGLVIAAAIGMYSQMGALNYPDLPLAKRIENAEIARENRPAQATVEATVSAVEIDPSLDPRMAELMVKLREALIDRPDDLQGHILLARNEAVMGNFVAAHRAQARVIDIKGDQANATDYANLADMMILAAGGYVSPEAETALRESLQRDPDNGTARYYSGLMFAQSDRADLAFRLWRTLLESSDPQDPWVEPIRAQIELVAADAGVRYTLPDQVELRGPTSEDVEAASDMAEEDRAQMIRGMVDGLAERLANEGGAPEEWARLIGALGVLGEKDRAAAIWSEAQTVFANVPSALDTIRAAAESAGVAD